MSELPASSLDWRDDLLVMTAAWGGLLGASSNNQLPGGFVGSLLHFHGPAAYALVGLLVFAEAGLLVGFFIPGETAVVIGGVLAGLHQVNLEAMMALVVVCAILGDSAGFEVGRWAGPWMLNHRPMKGNTAVARTLALLERYGGPAVFLGRFLAFARAVIPGLAGFSGLRYRTFLLFNAAGGLLWGVGYTLLGYVVGVAFEHILTQVGLWSAGAVAGLVVIAAVIAFILHRRRERQKPAGEPGSGPESPPADVTATHSVETASPASNEIEVVEDDKEPEVGA
jgi:membrane-associated protein